LHEGLNKQKNNNIQTHSDKTEKQKERIALVGGIHMVWTDVSLSWDPNTYGGIKFIDIPSSDIWLPKVYLMNNAGKVSPIGEDQTFQVQVTNRRKVCSHPVKFVRLSFA
jgi:hypothetical protein